jgi:hypothetical protein
MFQNGHWQRKKCPKKSIFLVAIQCCVYVHDMPCRANCIPSTVTHQWEDWTRMHVEQTAYHRLWPTNEKTGLIVYIPCLTNCMPYHLLLPTNEKTWLTVYMPCRTNCMPYQLLLPTNEKTGLIVYMPCRTNYMPYHLLSPTNEKTGHVRTVQVHATHRASCNEFIGNYT